MANELQRVVQQSRELWQKLPPRRRLILVGSVAATLLLVGFLALRPQGEEMTVLCAGLPDDEAARIVEYLKAQAIPYKVERGNAIEVPSARLHDARLGLALNDVAVGGGGGFELFDKQTFGTTSFVEQVNYQRALQGELERTIRSLSPVQKARVHITRPERSVFKDEEKPPTASVTVTLKPGRRLSAAQVRGIVHVVAASVEGLALERVTLVDDSGAVLWAGGDESGAEGQQDRERALARHVTSVLEPIVGPGHVEVVVNAELDLGRTDRTEETFDKDKIALRSEQKSEEKSSTPGLTAGGVAGATGNLPGAPAPAPPATAAPATATAQKLAETRNYEINHTIVHRVGPKADLKRLHVAVLVDHAAKPGAPGQRVPRSAEELKRIEDLARAAAGIDSQRGDRLTVESAPFLADAADLAARDAAAASPWQKPLVWVAIAAPALLMVLVLAFVLRRRRRQNQGAEELPLLPATVGELEKNLPAGGQAQLGPATVRDRVGVLVRTDAPRAAELISHWLAEPPLLPEQKSA